MREEILNLGRYRCRVLVNDVPGLPIVFLHGYSFTSSVWVDIGLLEQLERDKIPFIAIDMPYGIRSACSPRTPDPEENVHVVYETVHAFFGSSKPVVVGASLGGYIALKYAAKHSSSGLMLIAPVKVFDKALVKWYRSYTNPVYIVVGTEDDVIDINDMEKLAELFPNAKLILYEGAKHPAYLDSPDRFREDLGRLYREVVEPSRP
ncbi:MAG: alpha/beta hydrolase [Thermoprotei archaeon]|nr:MAG: alpha/beta hydrolase [Thermoprotei archaeon]